MHQQPWLQKAQINIQKEFTTYTKTLFGFIIIFTSEWIIIGITAFITSIICLSYSGTTSQKIIGLVLAILFGPFYWIYYGAMKDYCNKL